MLTVGHIIPRSKGGPSSISNYRPLCNVCNSKEGNSVIHLCVDDDMFEKHLKGKPAYKNSKLLGTIESCFYHRKEGWKFSLKDRAGTVKIDAVKFSPQ